jgi:hypothetical protein
MSKERIRTGRRLLTGVVVSLSVGIVSLAGCGGGSEDASPKSDAKAADETSIRNVLGELQEASKAGEGRRICNEIFTPKLADSVTNSSKSGSCAKEVKRQLFSPTARLTVEAVTVNDPANATATIKEANGNRSTVFFVKQSGRWRIRSVQAA